MDWDTLDRLYEKGMIENPRSKAKSIVFTDEGARRAEELFAQLFGTAAPQEPSEPVRLTRQHR